MAVVRMYKVSLSASSKLRSKNGLGFPEVGRGVRKAVVCYRGHKGWRFGFEPIG